MTGQCRVCGASSPLIAEVLSLCPDCIRWRWDEAVPWLEEAHGAIRAEFDLPPQAPAHPDGIECPLCTNACRLVEGEAGLCGLRSVRDGQLVHLAGTAQGAMVHWYDDPLPTNCTAAWVCGANTSSGTDPARQGSHQAGRVNLAVFYESCTFNCISCQNWHFRLERPPGLISSEELAAQAHDRTSCVCYFGGDPSPQMPHALATSRLLARQGVRICWETNGSMHLHLLDQAVDLSLRTGGCIKFDIKAKNDKLHRALTGVSNRRTLANFRRATARFHERRDPPLVVASTLLVPGYVDAGEVGRIARFIANIDPSIPYTLLGFHPSFYAHDLPRTSVHHARLAELAARRAGLTRVRIGNRHLLSREY